MGGTNRIAQATRRERRSAILQLCQSLGQGGPRLHAPGGSNDDTMGVTG